MRFTSPPCNGFVHSAPNAMATQPRRAMKIYGVAMGKNPDRIPKKYGCADSTFGAPSLGEVHPLRADTTERARRRESIALNSPSRTSQCRDGQQSALASVIPDRTAQVSKNLRVGDFCDAGQCHALE